MQTPANKSETNDSGRREGDRRTAKAAFEGPDRRKGDRRSGTDRRSGSRVKTD